MKPLLPVVFAALTFLAPVAQARTVTLTEADNGKSVTLGRGDMLTVDLPADTAAGYTWYVVYDPNGPLRLSGGQSLTVGVGMSSTGSPVPLSQSTWVYFSFTVPQGIGFARRGYLNLLRRRNEAGVRGGTLWRIHYTIKAEAKTAK